MTMSKKQSQASGSKALRYELIMIAASSVLLIAASVICSIYSEMSKWLRLLLYLIPYVIAAAPTLVDALDRLLRGKLFEEELLMSAASVCALCIGEHPAAVAVMLFYRAGKAFERYFTNKSLRAAGEISDVLSEYAWAEVNGQLRKLDPSRVPAGAVIVVAPGERVPLDGVLLEGSGSVDTSPLTGKSAPRRLRAGDTVVSGCVNLDEPLRIRVSEPLRESTAVKLLDIIDTACTSKAHRESAASIYRRFVTPFIALTALVLAIVPPFMDGEWAQWIGRAAAMLALSYPGALLVSVPMSFLGGICSGAKSGIFFKSYSKMETLSSVGTAVLDKTGTVTEGSFSVTAVEPVGISSAELLSLAAGADSRSSHPVALALRRACSKLPAASLVSEVQEIPGRGVKALVCGREVLVGNAALLSSEQIAFSEVRTKSSLVYVALDGNYSGYILIDDRVKEGAKESVRELHSLGVENVVMLTGDAEITGRSVGHSLGVNDIMTGLLPGDKVVAVGELLREKHDGCLIFIGDGVSDAAVLSRADVGLAIGAFGSGQAMEASDVVLMDDDIRKAPLALKLAQRTVSTANFNIWLSLLAKLALTVLAAVGLIGLWPAVFADTAVLVIATINSIRTFKIIE